MEGSSEEREMEAQALQSIYGEQFTVVVANVKGEGNPPVTYEMKLQQTKTKIIFTIPGKIVCHFIMRETFPDLSYIAAKIAHKAY